MGNMKFMSNIKFMGKFDDKKQLATNPLPKNAIQFEEGKDMHAVIAKGVLTAFPIALLTAIIGFFKLGVMKTNGEILNKKEFVIAFILLCCSLIPLLIIHEIIHAVCYPPKAKKEIWNYPSHSIVFVYCEKEISKLRFIVVCLAPSIILDIIPFLLWVINYQSFSIAVSVCIILKTMYMVLMSGVDYFNVYNTCRQVPRKATVFNHGFHSYWRKASNETNL